MRCFVCGEHNGYPVCNSCTREGYDINKIFSGEQKPKVDLKTLVDDKQQKLTGVN